MWCGVVWEMGGRGGVGSPDQRRHNVRPRVPTRQSALWDGRCVVGPGLYQYAATSYRVNIGYSHVGIVGTVLKFNNRLH